MKYVAILSSCVLVLASSTGSALASTEAVLFSFTGGLKGSCPMGGLVADSSGALYGTTSGAYSSANRSWGTVFKVTPPAKGNSKWGYSELYSFAASADGGRFPNAGLVFDKSGALYGTTMQGGANGRGTVFKLTPPGGGSIKWTETTLYSFTYAGDFPVGTLIFGKGGALYGTTSSFNGTVFSLAPPAAGQTNWTETTLYAFQGGADGSGPHSAVIQDAAGVIYGTTEYGGNGTQCMNSNGCGTVFQLAPPVKGKKSWTKTTLYSFFGGADGSFPFAGVVKDKNGVLFGTAVMGGSVSGEGVVYSLTPPAAGQTIWTQTVIHTFQGTDGYFPYAGLIFGPAGILYGTTQDNTNGNKGSVFSLTPPETGQTDWAENTLYIFQGGATDGAYPYAPLLLNKAGDLFGTTYFGGTGGRGTVFELTP